jgi:pyridoxal phosphate enzyme (YggS family)
LTEAQVKTVLNDRLRKVEERIESACRRSGRNRAEVALVAVTKSVGPEVAALLPECGLLDLGESRPQELWRKAAVLPKTVRWHLVGHLQRNKIEPTLPLVHLLHSVDSIRLLEALEKEALKRDLSVDVLLEINASRESSKHGFSLEEALGMAPKIASLKKVQVKGLMTMAALKEDPEGCRPTFAEMRKLRDGLQTGLGPSHSLIHLSMGMSNDFEIAVEEGATLVRIGTVLFEGLS